MLCNDGKNIVNLSDKKYRSCHLSKCGGWRFVYSGCSTKKFGCVGTSGAWLPVASVCNSGLYRYGGFSQESSGSSSSSLGGSTIIYHLERQNRYALGWAGSSVSSNFDPLPVDMAFYIKNATYGGDDVSDLVSSVEWDDQIQSFIISIDPKYQLNGSIEARFQFDLLDSRFRTLRNVFVFKNKGPYEYSRFVYPRVNNNYVVGLSQSSIDFLHEFLVNYWEQMEVLAAQGVVIPFYPAMPSFSAPEGLPEEFGEVFDPFIHALYKIYEEVPFEGYESGDQYYSDNIELIKQYSLDKELIDWFYNVGPAQEINLDSSTSVLLPLSSTTPSGTRSGVEGNNFLGVSPGVFSCMLNGTGPGGKLYQNYNQYSPIQVGPDGVPLDPSFDCRSFAESAAIGLRAALIGACPQVKVSIFYVYGHAINKVDLGGICADGNPCDCCNGSFLYEPQGGSTFDDLQDYCTRTGSNPCLDPRYPDGVDPNFDVPGPWRTGWDGYEKECKRIASVICGCLPANPVPGSSEESLKSECDSGNMANWFKDNFAYDSGSKNGPGKVPNLPIDFEIGCEKWRCDNKEGCVKDPNGDMTEQECIYCKERWVCQDTQSSNPCVGIGKSIYGELSKEECEKDCVVKVWCNPPCPNECCRPVVNVTNWRVATPEEYAQNQYVLGYCSADCSGAWCTGELGCDGTFYENGCDSGYLDKWEIGNANSKVSGFQFGKSCGGENKISCENKTPPEQCDCLYEWFASYNCGSSSWEFYIQGPASAKCGTIDPDRQADTWIDDDLGLGPGYRSWISASGKCNLSSPSSCGQNPPSPPPLPSNEDVPAGRCGAWCSGFYGASFSTFSCEEGSYEEWEDQANRNLGANGSPPLQFNVGKKCDELDCYGSWCYGEISCDGKFYIDDCNSGSKEEWQVQKSEGKALDYNMGKECSEINCQNQTKPECVDCWVCDATSGPINVGPNTKAWCDGREEGAGYQSASDLPCCLDELTGGWTTDCQKQCVHQWKAEYDCGSAAWKILGSPTIYCGYPSGNLEVWEDFVDGKETDVCYKTYAKASGSCEEYSDCVMFTEIPPPPNLPSNTPDCCGAWCVGKMGCDNNFYITGCRVGSQNEHLLDQLQDKTRSGFNASKSCSEITCPVLELPKCGAWCTGEFGCDGKFYVSGCDSGTLAKWTEGNLENKVQNFQEGAECDEIECVVEAKPSCQCVYEWYATYDCSSAKWSIDGPNKSCGSPSVALDQWVDIDYGVSSCDRKYTSASGSCKSSDECTSGVANPSPPAGIPSCCGAWCTGEFGCDGKFYVTGCNSGSIYDWQADNDQNKAQNFQEGKACSDISCVVETLPSCQCVYEWVAKYDCDTGWSLIGGGQPYNYCGSPLRPLDQWAIDDVGETPLGSCYRTYTSVSGSCATSGSCDELVFPPSSLPSETPSCCGAWCTGEFACDGKFYVTGCNSGALEDWQSDNSQNKAQNFQDGKKCSDISCLIETLPDCSSSSSCSNPPNCNNRQFVNDNCECECFSAAVNGCEPPKMQTGPECDCLCPDPPTCGANQVLNDNCECECSCPAGECCEVDASDPSQYVCVPCSKCICDPYSGPIPSDEGTEDCSLCQKTWVCDSQQGPVENPGFYYPVWSTTGPTEEQAKETCKETFDCYGGCYGYWTDYYYGQFNSLAECESECVDRYYCQGWTPYGGEPCYSMGPDTYGEKNCDKCQIIGYQCDFTYGKIPVYGDPNAPLPSGLMSETDVCYETYSCDSYNQCVLQGWAMSGDNEDTCKLNCSIRAWECNQSIGCKPLYGTSPVSLSPGQYNTESDCNISCLERYDCQPWGCYSVGHNTDPNLPTSCGAMDCVERYECNPSGGCQSVGYGKTGPKSCVELDCSPKYKCDLSQGCVISGYGPTATGSASCGDLDCSPKYECDQNGKCVVCGYGPDATGSASCQELDCAPRYKCDETGKCVVSGYGPDATGSASCEELDCSERYVCGSSGDCVVSGYGPYANGYKNISDCEAQCVVPTCVNLEISSCGFPAGNCSPIERFAQTVSVPQGMTLPVFVTLTGYVDDVLMIDGNVVEAGQTVGMYGCLVEAGNYSFVLNSSSFTIGAGDTVGFCSGYSYEICFHQSIPPGAT